MQVMKLGGGIAATVALMGMAVPAEAQRYRGGGRGHHHRGHDRVSVGDALLGVALIGGLLALTSSEKKRRERAEAEEHEAYEENADAGSPAEYDGTYNTESAQDRCVAEVETMAQAYARLSRVSAVTSTVWNGGSWAVKGAVELADSEDDKAPRTHRWRCALRAGNEPVITFEGL